MPLLIGDDATEAMRSTHDADPLIIVWWATPVECVSAIARIERDGALTSRAAAAALETLHALAIDWHEIQPTEPLRRVARRLLRTHPLRAADALQLAAALTGAEGDPSSLPLVTLDIKLGSAARREGFDAIGDM